MGVSYVYQSAKDVLKWRNLSVREHIGTVMQVGNLVYLSDKAFDEITTENEFLEISKEDLDRMIK
ncbi:MAG: hypothetical protein KAH30_02745 [Caldisericia bacterium]|nr:hypothetical protein [Caldisericia bacterium]